MVSGFNFMYKEVIESVVTVMWLVLRQLFLKGTRIKEIGDRIKAKISSKLKTKENKIFRSCNRQYIISKPGGCLTQILTQCP
jgi:hypothetical protein